MCDTIKDYDFKIVIKYFHTEKGEIIVIPQWMISYYETNEV